MTYPGTLYIVSAPSGAGKTSLLKALVESGTDVLVSVSHTTRPPRSGEEEGVHYHFVDTATFAEMLLKEAFLEHAQVFGNYYGTSRLWVEQQLTAGHNVILEIDWQGAREVREAIPGCVSIFILPPSLAVLEDRLRGRGQDDEAVIARRMNEAIKEMTHLDEYDYLVVNEDFETALDDLQAILRARRLETAVQRRRIGTKLEALLA